MKKSKEIIQNRSDFIRQFVNNYKGSTVDAVKKVSDRLYLSESTIWKALNG